MAFRSVTFATSISLVNLLIYAALIALPANQCLSQESVHYLRNWLEALQSKNRFTLMNVAYGSINFDIDPQNSASILISALKHPDANIRRYVSSIRQLLAISWLLLIAIP